METNQNDDLTPGPVTLSRATVVASTHQEKAKRMLAEAALYDIDCQELAEMAGEMLRNIKAAAAALTEQRMAITKPLDASKKAIMEMFAPALDVLEKAEGILKPKLGAWLELERKRVAAEKEKARLLAVEEAKKLQAQAAAQAAAGEHEEARTLEQKAMGLPSVAMRAADKAAPAGRVAGISTRETWTWRVTDVSKIPREYMIPDGPKIGGIVRALKGETNIPGIEAFPETTTAARK